MSEFKWSDTPTGLLPVVDRDRKRWRESKQFEESAKRVLLRYVKLLAEICGNNLLQLPELGEPSQENHRNSQIHCGKMSVAAQQSKSSALTVLK